MGLADTVRSIFERGGPSPIISDPSLDQLREGYLVDYDLQTWEVTQHTKTEHEGGIIDTWILRHEADKLRLEHIADADRDFFRLSKPIEMSNITATGTPLLGIVREEEPPEVVRHRGRKYNLAEEYTRTDEKSLSFGRSESDQWIAGLWGGIAAYLGVSATLLRSACLGILVAVWYYLGVGCYPWGFMMAGLIAYFLAAALVPVQSHPSSDEEENRRVVHNWVYRDGEEVLILEYKSNGWTAYAGRKVDPYEFDDILPRRSS